MSQGRGNRGFAAALTEQVNNDVSDETSSAKETMASRSTALSRLATGKIVTDRTEFVDPARCRPWRLHNRELAKLNDENCADLIEAFKSAGKQRIPAIVRPLRNDPTHDFEIVAGVRRWWTVQYLREHHHPEFDYLVTIQNNMTDEEAFRVADLENRARRDISPMERALDYLRAIDEFYEGSQDMMAERLNVSKSWMSRILDVGRLPSEIVGAFPDSHEITVRIARDVAPLARNADTRARMIEEAGRLTAERNEGGEIDTNAVAKRLIAAAQNKVSSSVKPSMGEVKAASGKPMIKYARAGRGGGLTVKVMPRSGATKAEIIKAFGQLLDDK